MTDAVPLAEAARRVGVTPATLRRWAKAGVIEVGNNVQAIFGTQADALKTDINDALAGMPPAAVAVAVAERPVADATSATTKTRAATTKDFDVLAPVPGAVVALDPQAVQFGGDPIRPRRELVERRRTCDCVRRH